MLWHMPFCSSGLSLWGFSSLSFLLGGFHFFLVRNVEIGGGYHCFFRVRNRSQYARHCHNLLCWTSHLSRMVAKFIFFAGPAMFLLNTTTIRGRWFCLGKLRWIPLLSL
jgi:hypothetical protein